jgi:hypothetical protein
MGRTERTRRPRFWQLWLALLAAACTSVHETPQTGTETGNPPVIHAELVTLAVSSDELHLIGAPGAVSPPGAQVEATSELTGQVFHAIAAADGSFDMQVDAPKTDSFQLRALQAGQSSGSVHVTRGGASVEDDAGEALSCEQRGDMARVRMAATVETADRRCTSADDCMLVSLGTACSDACSDVALSAAGAAQIEAEREAIEGGLCKDFARDSCNVLVLPCTPPLGTGRVCENGSCALRSPLQQTADCSSDFDPGTGSAGATVYWHASRAQVCVARVYGGSGGNGNRYASLAECEAACPHSGGCPPNRIETQVCVEPSPLAGCGRMALACALACSDAAACDGDEIGPYCTSGACQQLSPL